MPRHKRPRGGQLGNQNARKHGLYAATLSPEEMNGLWRTLSHGDSDPDLAIIRMKSDYIIRHDPGNQRLLQEVSRLLYKWMHAHYQLSRR